VTAVMADLTELEEIDRPPRRLAEEPLNRDNAFIIAALSFIPRVRGGSLYPVLFVFPSPSLRLPFTLFSPQRIHCHRVVGG